MSRPSLSAQPIRDVASVVADMLGESKSSVTPLSEKNVNPLQVETFKPQTVNTAKEKTSFALRSDVKRHLTLLKLDLRAAGHRTTEAEIVEALIAQADVASVAALFKPSASAKAKKT